MPAYFRALSVVIRMFLEKRSSGKQSQITLGGRTALRVIPEDGNIRGTLLAVHGMTAKGNTDPRIHVLASAFAANGYEVILPHYPEIQKLTIDSGCIHQMEDDLLSLSRMEGRGPVGVFSASFSGSLAMVAASGRARDAVRCMALVGPFGHVLSVVEHLFDAEDRDPYGFYVVLKNFLPGKGKRSEMLRRFFEEAALDDGLQRNPRHLPAVLADASPALREEFYRIQNDDEYRREIKERIMHHPSVLAIAERIDVIEHCGGIKAPVTLIHGDRDNVIPPAESRLLFDKLRDRLPCKLCITPLISHGTVQYGIDVPLRVHQVTSSIAFFLRSLDRNG